jgi:hypothetical protein
MPAGTREDTAILRQQGPAGKVRPFPADFPARLRRFTPARARARDGARRKHVTRHLIGNYVRHDQPPAGLVTRFDSTGAYCYHNRRFEMCASDYLTCKCGPNELYGCMPAHAD